jgi:mycothiol synthase
VGAVPAPHRPATIALVPLPAGYSLRPPRMDDGPAVVEMFNEESRALIGVAFTDLDWVTAPWTAPGVKLERDHAVVLDAAGKVAGYFFVQSQPPHTAVFSVGGVALAHHGRGLGTAIVEEIGRRAERLCELAPAGAQVMLRMGALADEPGVSALLRRHGFRETRRFLSMRIAFDGPPADAVAPPGIDLDTLAAGEEDAVYDCLAQAFQDHWGDAIESREVWLHNYVHAADDFDPGLWQVARGGGLVQGALVASMHAAEDPDMGYIHLVGVRRDSRGRGIGEALLRRSFRSFHGHGRSGAVLVVDSQSVTGATRLYERVGMTARPRFSQWERELVAARG